MSVRYFPLVPVAALLGVFVLAAPAAAFESVGPVGSAAAWGGIVTFGRAGTLVAALVGLVGTAVGGLALTRPSRTGAFAALAAGLVSVALGGLFAYIAEGGPGSGSGVVGAYVAIVVGLVAAVLGCLVLLRARHTG